MSVKLDIILFGATGFTGKRGIETLMNISKEKNLTWGVAGRNKDKLINVLKEVSDKTGTDVTKIPKFVADVGDEKSLQEMAVNCKVLVNCCGPYRFYGEPVIKACLAAETHHLDVSGEPQFMETMQLKYHKEAEEKGIYLISACGFDSIVCEMGIIHMMDHFQGQLNSIETYLQFESGSSSGASIHYGTWESAIYSIVHSDELPELRKQLYPNKLPKLQPKLKPKSVLHKSPVINKWCLPFLGSDRSIAIRSQRFFYEQEKKRPIQLHTYVGFKSLINTIMVAIVGVIFGLLVKISFTRRLLLNYPRIFSLGYISHEGPSEEHMVNSFTSTTFYGEGWSEKSENPEEQNSEPPNKTMITKLTCQDPGYGFTTTSLILCAVAVLNEADQIPGKGGVLTTGVAFAKTTLLKDLMVHGLKVEVVS